MIQVPFWLAAVLVVAVWLRGGFRSCLYLATGHKPYTPKH